MDGFGGDKDAAAAGAWPRVPEDRVRIAAPREAIERRYLLERLHIPLVRVGAFAPGVPQAPG